MLLENFPFAHTYIAKRLFFFFFCELVFFFRGVREPHTEKNPINLNKFFIHFRITYLTFYLAIFRICTSTSINVGTLNRRHM